LSFLPTFPNPNLTLFLVCSAAVFRLAEDADLDYIHIRGHHDVSVLNQWLREN
jgi:hypothetical protein